MSHYKTIKVLGIPHVVHQGIINFLDDFELAVMLNHLLYWSDKTDNPLGVYRSNAEWYDLFRFKDAKVKNLSDELQKRGLIKKTYKRLEHRMYYLLNVEEFDHQYEEFANQQNNTSPIAKNEIGEHQKIGLAEGKKCDSLYTKITTKITTKNTTKNNIHVRDESKTLNVPFDVFWDAYDKKIGTKKCETLWKRLSDQDRLDIMAYIPKYKLSQPDKQFRKNPQTFLNNRAWKDEIIDNQQEKRLQPNKPNRMAEFAEQSTQWGDDFYNQQPTIGAIE